MSPKSQDRTSYYYTGGERIELVQDPRYYAVRFKPGQGSRNASLSRRAHQILRDDSAHVTLIPNYGLQIYRANPQTPSLRRDSGNETRDTLRAVRQLNQEPAVEMASPAYRRHAGESLEADGELMFTTREFLAHFRPETTSEQIQSLNDQFGVTIVEPLRYAENGYMLAAPQSEGELGPVALANAYYESGLVTYAHPNFIRQIHFKKAVGTSAYSRWQTSDPRDGLEESQTASRADRNASFLDRQWHLDIAHVPEAWNVTRGDAAIKIAILDDGVDVGHAEFSGKIVDQYDFAMGTTDASPKYNDDRHGTACAGVALARGVKAFGAAPACSLLAVRMPASLSSADVASMFQWAADQGADVISCSWGPDDGTGRRDLLPDTVRAAIHYCLTRGRGGRGIPIFWAAGNGDESVSLDGYASNPDVMAVAASSSNERRSSYSDYGPEIFICAPSSGDRALGEKAILTTDRRGGAGYNPDPQTGAQPPEDLDYTATFGGTSSATPLLAGICGLILSVNGNLGVSQVKDILRATTDRIDPSGGLYDANGHSHQYGYGRVNALRAVRAAQQAGGGGAVRPARPSIQAQRPTMAWGDSSPTFTIDTAGRRLYAVEVATEASLLDSTNHRHRRNAGNFYGSWQDGPLLSRTPYRLPTSVWNQLRGASRLYYRVHVTNDTRWSNVAVSTPDEQANSAPSIEIRPAGHSGDSTPGSGGGGTPRIVTFPSGARFNEVLNTLDGVDYSDPVAGGAVPLIDVGNRRTERLSANFTVRELAASDGARYARISPDLVVGLQRIRARIGTPLEVVSGYRHPRLNQSVRGAATSQHLAGRAAAIRSSALRPLELVRVALAELGPEIGIGLGRSSIQVDLRGSLATFVFEGAEMGESEFDFWVRENIRGNPRTTIAGLSD